MEDATVKNILEKIELSKNEIKRSIEASEANILLELENLKFRVGQLERENFLLRDRVERLDRGSRKNSIILFGWSEPNEQINLNFVCSELGRLLEINVDEGDINDFYCLGKKVNRPVKIEFISHLKKLEVIRNCGKLKGCGITIASDLTVQQRLEYRSLKEYMTRERDRGNTCIIRKNKLVVNHREYTLQELQETEKEIPRHSSTPATPTQPPIFETRAAQPLKESEPVPEELARSQLDETTPDINRKLKTTLKPITRLRTNLQRKN